MAETFEDFIRRLSNEMPHQKEADTLKKTTINSFKNSKYYQIVTIDQLFNNLDELNFDSIALNGLVITQFADNIIQNIENDYEHPFTICTKAFKTILKINPEYFLDHQETVFNVLKHVVSKRKNKFLTIDSTILINDDIIDSICQNETLEDLTLAKYDETPYILSEKHFKKLKESAEEKSLKKVNTIAVEEPLKENFDSLIECNSNRKLIKFYTYDELQSLSELNIYKDLTEEELENLKYLNEKTEIIINSDLPNTIFEVITKIRKFQKANSIIIDIKNNKSKENFNKILFNSNLSSQNIFVRSHLETIPLNAYLHFEKQLYDMLEPAKNLSPFEKYIFAYNKVKKFKEYKESEVDKWEARSLYRILQNEFMVCVGFSEMFGDLLSKVGIENKKLSVGIDTSYDGYFKGIEDLVIDKEINFAPHARNYVHIVDEKYNIDGFYISDPTWDNDLEKDYYNFLAITNEEEKHNYRGLKFNPCGVEELFDVKTLQEFYQKINFLLDRKYAFAPKTINDIIENLIEEISKLDSNKANEFLEKYPYLKDYKGRWSKNTEEYTDLLYDLGTYIVDHTNKPISGQTILKAVREVYIKAYDTNPDQIDEKIIQIMLENAKKQEEIFPKITKIDDLGSYILFDETNKFNPNEQERETEKKR